MSISSINDYTYKYVSHEVAKELCWLFDRVFKKSLEDFKTSLKSENSTAPLFYKEKIQQIEEMLSNLDGRAAMYSRYLNASQRKLIREAGLDAAEQHIAELTQKVIDLKVKD